MRELAAIVLLGAAACARGGMAQPDAEPHDPPDARRADAPGPAADANQDPDAPVVPGAPHLLLTEVSLAPNAGELIEIANPTAATVDLSTYYVTDVPTYFRLPAATATIDQFDFVARFPAGAVIQPGAVITISIDTAANFQTNYAVAPTYSLAGGTMIVQPPTGTRNLTNTGEPVVLFRWDGTSDLVTDVDIVIAGNPTVGNALVVKSAAPVDGPDADTTPSVYAADANTIPTTTAPASAKSIKRILLEAGHEIQLGAGNGVGGDDETSEQIAITWDSTYTAPTPGTTPPL